jgi:hypothetical protein
MNKRYLAALFAILPLLWAAPARAALTEEEKALVTKCYQNIDPAKKLFSPKVAAECTDAFAVEGKDSITEKMRAADDQLTSDIINYNSAVKDLGDIIGKQGGMDIAVSLRRVLEQSDCSLCKLELGSQPEKLFTWADKYYAAKGFEVRRSVRTWEALGNIRQESLGRSGKNMADWNAQLIMYRYRALHEWAVKETDSLVRVPADRADKAKTTALAQILMEDLLSNAEAQKLRDYLNTVGVAAPKKTAANMKGSERLASEMNKLGLGVGSLKGQSAAAQSGILGNMFDNQTGRPGSDMAAIKIGSKTPAAAKQQLSPDQVKVLAKTMVPHIQDAVKGIAPGDDINAFYASEKYKKAGLNKMDFDFEPMQWDEKSKMYGGYSPSTMKIRVNSAIVEEWMTKRGVTAEALFANGGKNKNMDDLAIFIAPTFVHESKHYKDHSDAILAGAATVNMGPGKNKGLPYDVRLEGNAFGYDSALSLGFLAKYGPGFTDKLDDLDKRNAKKFLEGGYQGLLDSNHRTSYSQLHSGSGQAAQEFEEIRDMQVSLLKLEASYKANPGAFSKDTLALMKKTRADIDAKYAWYQYMAKKTAEEEKKINEWRDEYKAKLFAASKSLKVNAPEELLP